MDLLRSGNEAAWLVAHAGLLALIWGQVGGERPTEVRVCGLHVVELSTSPPGSFYLSQRKPPAPASVPTRHEP